MLARLKWLTFLSLDAPLVAVSWQALFAREHGSRLSWHHSLIVFLSVWLGYAADRWCDNLKRDRPASEQHRFYALHSRQILAVWLGVLVTAVSLAFACLTAPELAHGFVLMGLSLAYTLFAQKGRKLKHYPLLKSTFTALLVLASSLLFIPIDSIPYLAGACVWLLFSSNCLYIRSWTHAGETNAAFQATLFATAVATLAVFTLCTRDSSIAAASLLAQSAILLLHLFRHRIDSATLRTAADLCLLSPWPILFLL